MYPDRHVKVFFKNGLTCEGIVIQWTDNEAFLQSLDNEDILHIYNVSENIMMVKVFTIEMRDEDFVMEPEPLPDPERHGRMPEEPEAVFHREPPRQQSRHVRRPTAEAVDYKREAAPIVEPPAPVVNFHPDTKHELRLKKLAELRNMQKKALEEQVGKRMRSHVPTNTTTTLDPYDTPSFTKPGPQNRPATQGRRRVRKNS
jgi:hypothetical protein